MVYIKHMNNTAAAAKLTAAQTTPSLILSLLAIDAKTVKTTADRVASAWICEAIEARYDVAAAMDAWADDDDNGMTYAEALLAALPMESVA